MNMKNRFPALLTCALTLGLTVNALACEVSADPLEALLRTIIPDDGPVRPPFEWPRYDLELDASGDLAELTAATLERQERLEARWHELRDSAAKTETPQRTLLAYAFGEAKLDDARSAADQLGDAWRFRFARLLLAECRFSGAIAVLTSLADGNGPQAQSALAQLVTLHEQTKALAHQVPMVPFEVNLKDYLNSRAVDPQVAACMVAFRKGVILSLAPVQKPDDPRKPTPQLVWANTILGTEEQRFISNGAFQVTAGWNPKVFTIENGSDRRFTVRSLHRTFLEEFSSRLVLYRVDHGSSVITGSEAILRLHTDCGGEIALKLYRFEKREEWEKLDAPSFAQRTPVQSWSTEFRPLSRNNRDTFEEYPIALKNLTEGYYLATAEARYLPVIATQKFAVSNVALYLRASTNQAVVAAVDRRDGRPVSQLPIQLVAHGDPDLQYMGNSNRSSAFRAGFNQTPVSAALDFRLPPKKFDECFNDYRDGLALRSRLAVVHSERIMTSDGTGTAVFPLDLRPGFAYSLQATRKTVGFAEAKLHLGTPLAQAEAAKAVVWPAQTLHRPGGCVNFKGVIRRFNGLQFSPHEANWKNSVTVIVTNGKEQLWQGRCELTAAGCFSGTFPVPLTAPLGTYDFLVDGEPAQPQAALKVEHFRVPTFHVDVRLHTPTQQGGKLVKGRASVQYCFGKPVANAEVEIVVEGLPGKPPRLALFTDAEGSAEFELPLQTVPQRFQGVVRATAMDASGESYSGFAQLTATPAPFSLEASALGGPTGTNARLDGVRLQACDWQNAPLAGVTVSMEGISETEVTDAQGLATIRFAQTTLSNRSTLQFTAIRGRDAVHLSKPVDVLTNPTRVTGQTSARGYTSEDLVRFSEVTCPQAGADLTVKLRVERRSGKESLVLFFASNTRMLAHRALLLAPGEHQIEIPTNLDFAPTCQLHVVLFTGKEPATDTYVAHVKPVQRFLTLEVATERQEYRPGETCRAVILARDWRQRPVAGAEISLGVINEALYDLQRSSYGDWEGAVTPDLQRFFHDYSLPDWSWNTYDGCLPFCAAEVWLKGPKMARGYWSPVEKPAAEVDWKRSMGTARGSGCAALLRKETVRPRTRRDFRTEAHWVANLITDAEGRAKVTFVFPDDITFWRFTARGVTPDTMVGEVCCKRRTFLPTQVEWALPRALRAGDRITATALVHNNTDQARKFTLSINGSSGKTVSVSAQGTTCVAHPLAPVQPGCLPLKATVQAQQAQECDTMERILPVLPRGYPTLRAFHGKLKDGGTIPLAMAGASRPEHLKLTVCVEPGVIGPITSALDELIQYPYGCVEQTMSRFLPAVVAGRALRRFRIAYAREKELPAILEQGVARLAGFQHQDGGWGWYKDDATNDFMTAYVLEGLTLCREVGHAVPARMLEQAERHAFRRLSGEMPASLNQVESIGAVSLPIYLAHTLALYYASEPSRFANQREQLKTLLPAAEKDLSLPRDHVLRADTYRLLGMPEKAKSLFREACTRVSPSLRDRSTIMAMASLLETGEALEPGNAESLELARRLIALRRGPQWNDTQTTATVVRGLSALIDDKPFKLAPVDLLVDGQNLARLTPTTEGATKIVLTSELAGAQTVTLRPSGAISADCFWSAWVSVHGVDPLTVPEDTAGTVTCRIFPGGPDEQEILPDASGTLRVRCGETLRIRLTCETRRPLDHLRVSLPRPCGVELIRTPKPGDPGKPKEFVAFEEHDDAFHFFFERCERRIEVDFLVRPQVSGRVSSPPPEMEPMYSDPVTVKVSAPCVWQIAEPSAR